jgi:hypothetical protein
MKPVNMKFIIALSILFCTFYVNIFAQVSIIANKNVNIKAIDINKLTNLYNLQSNEVGSQKVKLFYLNSENETEKSFLGALGKSFIELKKIWLKAKLTANGTPPETVSTEDEMIQKVGSTPNAVGFVDSKNVKGTVKVIEKLGE